jgi:hypothetical protein
MFELTIEGQVYAFKFGIGFMREMNKKQKRTENGVTKEIGLQMAVAGLIDGDVEDLINVLDVANKTEQPRLTRAQIEGYIENDDTDIDELFDEVIDFLSKANATKKQTKQLLEMWEKEKAKNQ